MINITWGCTCAGSDLYNKYEEYIFGYVFSVLGRLLENSIASIRIPKRFKYGQEQTLKIEVTKKSCPVKFKKLLCAMSLYIIKCRITPILSFIDQATEENSSKKAECAF